MKALDLFCGAGGASEGLRRAGFKVTGVDIVQHKQAHIIGDVLELPVSFLRRFDFIWASPPCQHATDLRHAPNGKKHPDLIPRTRKLLLSTGVPFVIENVEGARLIDPVTLCGSMFGLGVDKWQLRRHRLFEAHGFTIPQPDCAHKSPTIGIYGGHVRCRAAKYWRKGGADFPNHDKPALAAQAMGIDWMTMEEISQAIPPAYAEHVGRAAMAVL